MSTKAIYHTKIWNNSINALFFMSRRDVDERNALHTNRDEDYEFVTYVTPRFKNCICPDNGHRCKIYTGEDGKLYKIYTEDHSVAVCDYLYHTIKGENHG